MSSLDDLKTALCGYYEAIDSQKTDQPMDLAAPMARLETFSLQPPADLHPQLRHYLESRSYRKAWTWVRGETPEKGSCGR
jgi:hypothetical protein